MDAKDMKALFLTSKKFVPVDKNIGLKLSKATNVAPMATMIYGGNGYQVYYSDKAWMTTYTSKSNSYLKDIDTNDEYGGSTKYAIEIWGVTPWGYLLKRYMLGVTNNIEIYQVVSSSVLTKIGGVLYKAKTLLYNLLPPSRKVVGVC